MRGTQHSRLLQLLGVRGSRQEVVPRDSDSYSTCSLVFVLLVSLCGFCVVFCGKNRVEDRLSFVTTPVGPWGRPVLVWTHLLLGVYNDGQSVWAP